MINNIYRLNGLKIQKKRISIRLADKKLSI